MMHIWILLLVGVLCNTLLFSSPVSAQGTSSSPASPTTELTVNSTTPYPTPQTPKNIIACESNDQCHNGKLCLNHLCMDACHPGYCVKNVNCQAGGHRPSCICIPGTTDNLKVKCIALSSVASMPQPPIGEISIIIPDSLIIPERKSPTHAPPLIATSTYRPHYDFYDFAFPKPIPTHPPITIGCENNDDCSTDNSCINKLCIDACGLGYCGEDAECQTSHHRPLCFCPPGTTGNPTIKCSAVAYVTFTPLPPIAGHNIIIDDSALARHACENNDNCPFDNSCINKICIDACSPGYCGEDADCQTSHHRPICTCPPSTTGNPLISCSAVAYDNPLIGVTTEPVDTPPLPGTAPPLPPQPPITGQLPSHLDSLIIPEAGPPPRTLPPLSETPIPITSQKTPRPVNPPIIPPIPIGCENNDDCTIDNSCINKLCIDACGLGICGDDADCRTHSHRPVCLCPYGTTGDPLIGCKALTGLITEHVEHAASLLTTPCYCL